MSRTVKDWDKIMAEIPTPPDSDAEDDLNVMSVQKNAQKVSDALHHLMPNLPSELAGPLPKGMNSAYELQRELKKTYDYVWDKAPAAVKVMNAAEEEKKAKEKEKESGEESEAQVKPP